MNLKLLYLFLLQTSILPGSDIAVVTMAVGKEFGEVVDIALKNKQTYCEVHGYDFICEKEHLDPERPIVWSKIPLILKVMENPQNQWIFWTDADALIMNMAFDLEGLINENYDLIVSKDFYFLNCGHFLIKNSEWSRQFLVNAYNHTECMSDGFQEQAAIAKELEQPHNASKTKIIPQRLFNSYAEEVIGDLLQSTYQKGDFILHFAGICEFDKLAELFELYHSEIIHSVERLTLNHFFGIYGIKSPPLKSTMIWTFSSPQQQKQYREKIAGLQLKNIASIGLNDGFCAEIFFQESPKLGSFVTFDNHYCFFTYPTLNYFFQKYKKLFSYRVNVQINEEIRNYAAEFPNNKFDLIHFEGNLWQSKEECLEIFKSAKLLAHPDTKFWIKDPHFISVQYAIDACLSQGIIEIKDQHVSEDINGKRHWIEAVYR